MRRSSLVVVIALSAVLSACAFEQPDLPSSSDDPSFVVAQEGGHEASAEDATRAVELQQRVDDVLAAIPGGHQVSPTELRYDGLNVTVDPLYSEAEAALAPRSLSAISCPEGFFCIIVRGVRFDIFKCGLYPLSGWWGISAYNNNQTWGTVARFYDVNGNEVWSSTAKDSGFVDVTPFWWFRPC